MAAILDPNKQLQFYSQYNVSTDEYDLWLRAVDNRSFGSKDLLYCKPLQWDLRKHDSPTGYERPPTLIPAKTWDAPEDGPIISAHGFLQAALDHAWDNGMRPKGFTDTPTEPQLAAMRYHLEDMRKLVFKGK